MYSKKIAIRVLAVFICIGAICGLFVFARHKNETIENDFAAEVTIKNRLIVKGEKAWESFKTAAYAGQEAEVTLHITKDDKQYDCNLKYDGERYSYYDTTGVSYKKTHLLDVEKKINGHHSRWIVLANDSYTFDDLERSISSSSSYDFIDFEILAILL